MTMARLVEDLPRLAREAFELAGHRCAGCRDFHALWPYVRLARASGAAEGGRSVVEPTLAGLMTSDRPRVLVAGAADTGLFALVARASAGRAETTVVDLCGTPLELCRRFAEAQSMAVETHEMDLADLDLEARFDVALVHSLLQFIAPNRRAGILSRLRQALKPDGRLVMVFRAGGRIEGALLPEYRAGYPDWVLGELDRLGVFLPTPRPAFRKRLAAYSRAREAREGALGSAEEVDALLAQAGFSVESRQTLESDLSARARQFAAKLGKRRYLTVAAPRS